MARTISAKLTERLGQQVVVDNRAGGGGNIAAAMTARAAPDGYTIFFGTISTLATNVSTFRKLPYDPLKDFAPVTTTAISPMFLVTQAAVPAASYNELIAMAKAKPGQLNYASSGTGGASHLMMELYRSEYKWMDVRTKLWAKNKELETGIDAEIYIGANYFTQSIYYQEVYAPMFHRNDSILIFNYPKDVLLVYSIDGNLMDSIPLYHHYQAKETGWKRNLIQDRMTGSIYTTYEKDGYCYLGLVNIKTGEISEKVKLTFRYVDKIRVHNNYVYYVYRPFESIQKKFLYKEKLPYQFNFLRLMIFLK